MNKKRTLLSIFVASLLVMGCFFTSFAPATSPPVVVTVIITTTSGAASEGATATFTSIAPLPPSVIPVTSCTATIQTGGSVNVRSGPGTVYDAIGSLSGGASAAVVGKSTDGTWWYIDFPSGVGGHGWVSASVVTASCIPTTLAIIAAPPTPRPASGTCISPYVWRLINPSDKICVSTASKSQADADNAAAASRKATYTYGPDTCISGYVWREAYVGDVVCVTPDVRTQAAADNAVAASRWVSGAYGPHTCIAGYVWREARVGDDVCVTPDVRTQAAADNAAAASRKVTSLYGPDTCATGYVWREAFSGDHVCVTPAVRSQVAADNAAAASHTNP